MRKQSNTFVQGERACERQREPRARSVLVPMAGLEPAHIAAVDFESTVSAIPPHRHY